MKQRRPYHISLQ